MEENKNILYTILDAMALQTELKDIDWNSFDPIVGDIVVFVSEKTIFSDPMIFGS